MNKKLTEIKKMLEYCADKGSNIIMRKVGKEGECFEVDCIFRSTDFKFEAQYGNYDGHWYYVDFNNKEIRATAYNISDHNGDYYGYSDDKRELDLIKTYYDEIERIFARIVEDEMRKEEERKSKEIKDNRVRKQMESILK